MLHLCTIIVSYTSIILPYLYHQTASLPLPDFYLAYANILMFSSYYPYMLPSHFICISHVYAAFFYWSHL